MDSTKQHRYSGGYHYGARDFDEMSESIIQYSDDNTVLLSLPDSFDDALTVHGIPLTEELFEASKYNKKKKQQRIDDDEEEMKSAFSKRIEEEKQRILSMGTNMDYLDIDRLKYLPRDRMTLTETVALVIQNKMTKEADSHRKDVSKLRDQIESLEYDLEEAARSKKAISQRFESLRSELAVSDGRQHELDSKIRELQEQLLAYKENERNSESLKQKSKCTEEELRSLRSQLEQQEKTLSESASAEKTALQKLVETERKLQSITTEKAFLQKEIDLVLERAERTEKGHHQCEAQLFEMTRKYEAAMHKVKETEVQAKATYEAKLADELSRVREESNKEVSQMFKNRIEAWERENSLLRESKTAFQKELERLKHELRESRETYDIEMAQHSKTASEQDRQLMDARNELKIKKFENANLVSMQDSLSAELKKANLQNEHIRQQLATHEKEFIKLEHESKAECKKLLDEIGRKNEQLAVYLQAEMQMEAEINAGNDPGSSCLTFDPRRRVQHCLDLASRCGELQKELEKLRAELDRLRKENDDLRKIKDSHEELLNYSKQPSGSLLSSLKEKVDEVQRLKLEREKCNEEMRQVRADREKFKEEVSSFLRKRQQLEQMIQTIQDLKCDPRQARDSSVPKLRQGVDAAKRPCAQVSSSKIESREHDVLSFKSSATFGGDADMSIHLIHHQDRNHASDRRPWHRASRRGGGSHR